jgi:L-threonylcarbamoyladenylate synthase
MRIRISPNDHERIREIAEVVMAGGVIVYPTDTVYGIGGDPFNVATVRRVLEIKRRG